MGRERFVGLMGQTVWLRHAVTVRLPWSMTLRWVSMLANIGFLHRSWR